MVQLLVEYLNEFYRFIFLASTYYRLMGSFFIYWCNYSPKNSEDLWQHRQLMECEIQLISQVTAAA